jgi:surface antigen
MAKDSETGRHRRMRGIAAAALMLIAATAGGWAAEPGPGSAAAADPPTTDSVGRAEGTGEPAPVRSFTDPQGRACRVYTRTVLIDGEPRTALATVCREPNGRWVLSR